MEQNTIRQLDELFPTNTERYTELVKKLKEIGYKIYRNSNGKHKLEYNNNYFNEVFGGIFRQK